MLDTITQIIATVGLTVLMGVAIYTLIASEIRQRRIDKAYEDRTNLKLVECVEKLGEDADGDFAELKVVDIPDDVEYTIEEYDGIEWVSEKHRTWC